MKYEDFMAQTISSLNNKRFIGYDLGNEYEFSLDNLNIRMYSEEPEDINERDKIVEHFRHDYPDFDNNFHITKLDDKEISIIQIRLRYNETTIFEEEFYSLAIASSHGLILPGKKIPKDEKDILQALCLHHSDYSQRESLLKYFNNYQQSHKS